LLIDVFDRTGGTRVRALADRPKVEWFLRWSPPVGGRVPGPQLAEKLDMEVERDEAAVDVEVEDWRVGAEIPD
jgi:hypothetical protein